MIKKSDISSTTRNESAVQKEAPKSLTDRAYEEIKWRIISDELKSGELLTEAEICEVTGFGKAPIRAALMELKHDKLINVVRRKGFFIRPWSATESQQLLFVRQQIEPPLAAEAARNANDADLQRLRDIVSEAANHIETHDRRALIRYDNEFHIAIAEVSGNQVGAEIVETLKLRSHYMWHVSIASRRQLEAVQGQHEVILDAILSGDPEMASNAAMAHLSKLEAE